MCGPRPRLYQDGGKRRRLLGQRVAQTIFAARGLEDFARNVGDVDQCDIAPDGGGPERFCVTPNKPPGAGVLPGALSGRFGGGGGTPDRVGNRCPSDATARPRRCAGAPDAGDIGLPRRKTIPGGVDDDDPDGAGGSTAAVPRDRPPRLLAGVPCNHTLAPITSDAQSSARPASARHRQQKMS